MHHTCTQWATSQLLGYHGLDFLFDTLLWSKNKFKFHTICKPKFSVCVTELWSDPDRSLK